MLIQNNQNTRLIQQKDVDDSKYNENTEIIDSSNINLELNNNQNDQTFTQVITITKETVKNVNQKRKSCFNPARAAQRIINKKVRLINNLTRSSNERSYVFQEMQLYNKESEIKHHDEQSSEFFIPDNLNVEYVDDFNVL